MPNQRIIIDNTSPQRDTRIVRATILETFYDMGLQNWIMNRMSNAGGVFATLTIGGLLNQILNNTNFQNNFPDALALIDRFSLELFIKDMAFNGFNIEFTNNLPIGERPEKATISGTPTGGVGQVSISVNVIYTGAGTLSKLFVRFMSTGVNPDFDMDTPLSVDGGGDGVAIVTSVPPDSYTVFVGGIADLGNNELRGFLSDESAQFSVT